LGRGCSWRRAKAGLEEGGDRRGLEGAGGGGVEVALRGYGAGAGAVAGESGGAAQGARGGEGWLISGAAPEEGDKGPGGDPRGEVATSVLCFLREVAGGEDTRWGASGDSVLTVGAPWPEGVAAWPGGAEGGGEKGGGTGGGLEWLLLWPSSLLLMALASAARVSLNPPDLAAGTEVGEEGVRRGGADLFFCSSSSSSSSSLSSSSLSSKSPLLLPTPSKLGTAAAALLCLPLLSTSPPPPVERSVDLPVAAGEATESLKGDSELAPSPLGPSPLPTSRPGMCCQGERPSSSPLRGAGAPAAAEGSAACMASPEK
jgi:hypothetical protein